MKARGLFFCLALVLLWPAQAPAQSASSDAEVNKGVQQVNDGDYDGAIVTLDAAARRLTQDPSRYRDLAQAYLYLGIAYVGKGHEAAAKAKFREAVTRMRDLTLSPADFPPKVIDLFEAAREETARAVPAPANPPAAARPAAAPAPAAKKGGGSGKYVLIGGGVAAVGVGAAVALGGGGGSGGGNSQSNTVQPEPQPQTPVETRTTDTRAGVFAHGASYQQFLLGPGGAGLWFVDLHVERPLPDFGFDVYTQNGEYVGPSSRTGDTSAHAEFPGVAGALYQIHAWCNDDVVGEVPFSIEANHVVP